MSFKKIGEAIFITADAIRPNDIILSDPEIVERFEKIASTLKGIAPKAKDFLYFAAIMMHSAEASLINDDGSIKKDASGNEVKAIWEKNGKSWKWICSDPNVKPYKNANNDIFPEEELIKAYRKWVGKPLCVDHKSDQAEMVRGIIVDTYYDYPKRRIVALCALDRKAHPKLARQVEAKYSTSVSMGTAVETAICSDCGCAAKCESEYCNCMRNRVCYGEINVGLNPIELSIVVNGADQKAQIRHVFAAVGALNKYIDSKKADIKGMVSMSELVDPEKLSETISCLKDATQQLEELKNKADQIEQVEEDESDEGETVRASQEFKNIVQDIHQSLKEMRRDIDKLSNQDGEKRMDKKSYYLGGGGVNEPTPGKPKYEKENYQTTRDKLDKQMTGVSNLGTVDGIPPEDATVKKQLQRLGSELERRRGLRREAIDKAKKSYYLGGGDLNDPEKLPYKKEPYAPTRDKEDKQMVGAKPFPDVGKVDGLYGDDLKVKQMLSRAKLSAKFVKAADLDGSDNMAKSAWHVFAGDKLVLSGTVHEIAQATGRKYTEIASRDFGQSVINLIRKDNSFNRASSLFKSAQLAAMPAPAVPPPDAALPSPVPMAPPVGPSMPATPPMDAAAPELDKGGDGDPKEQIPDLLNALDNVAADLREAIMTLIEQPEQVEDFESLSKADEEGQAVAKLLVMQRKIAKLLAREMYDMQKKVVAHRDDLKVAAEFYKNKQTVKRAGLDVDYVSTLASDTVKDAKKVYAEAVEMAKTFVKFAKGTVLLKKRAEGTKPKSKPPGELGPRSRGNVDFRLPPESEEGKQKKDRQKAEDSNAFDASGNYMTGGIGGLGEGSTVTQEALNRRPLSKEMHDASASDVYKAVNPPPAPPPPADMSDVVDMGNVEDLSDANAAKVTVDDKGNAVLDNVTGLTGLTPATASKEPDLTTKEGRAQFRDMLAKQAKGDFAKILDDAHAKGWDPSVGKTQVDPKVETLPEQHEKMMSVVNATPKVRQAAEKIQKHIRTGAVSVNDVDKLVSLGVDPEAVKYWKQYYGEGDKECSQFATELTKMEKNASTKDAEVAQKAKLDRAYELTYDMVDRGMLPREKNAIKQQVGEIMQFNDASFESFARWVSRQSLTKVASIPSVGMMSDSAIMPKPEVTDDFAAQLASIFDK